MGGRRRDFDGQFAMAEIGFWFNDPRLKGTSAAFKIYIHYAWMVAVKERRETLQSWYTPAILGAFGGLDTRTSRKCADSAIQKCLHSKTTDGRIIVCGVRKKHPNLTWRDDTINDGIGANNPPQAEAESETETEEAKPRAREIEEPKSKTPAQIDNDRLVEAIRIDWLRCFRSELPYSQAQTLLAWFEERGWRPSAAMGHAAEREARQPFAYLRTMAKGSQNTEPAFDAELGSYQDWLREIDGQTSARRGGRIGTVGDVLEDQDVYKAQE